MQQPIWRRKEVVYHLYLVKDGWESRNGRQSVNYYEFKLVPADKPQPRLLRMDDPKPEDLGCHYIEHQKLGSVAAYSIQQAWRKAGKMHPVLVDELSRYESKGGCQYSTVSVGSANVFHMGSLLDVQDT